jgi:hypothetical protein
MNTLIIVVAVVVLVFAVMLFQMRHLPTGIEREHRIEHGKIFSTTRTVTSAPTDEVIRLLQTDWSWWDRAHAEKMKDLGDGRKEFFFHPIRYFNLIQVPPVFLVRFERTERLPDGGVRIHATLTGDFDGPAEYTARPGNGGTIVELAWCGAEVRSVLRFAPISLVAAIHCWRERLGVEGLRDRLRAAKSSS